ncbi:MAG: LytR/AlgR family response regulator transcription factor [Bacteroidia bacterium]
MKYQCIIVDDERPALKLIEAYLEKLPHIEVVATCENAFEALDVLHQQPVDILFLDVNMPGLTGFELLKSLSSQPQVIMTTSYREYAVEGFEASVTDYLVKPFAFQRFLQAVNKAIDNIKTQAHQAPVTLHDEKEKQEINILRAGANSFFIRKNGKMEKVNVHEILYVESMREYVSIHVADRRFVVHQTMRGMEEKLPPPDFMRVHRSFLVSMNHLDTVQGNTIKIGDKEIPIGGSYRQAFFERIEML